MNMNPAFGLVNNANTALDIAFDGFYAPMYHIERTMQTHRKVVCKHWLRGLCKKGQDCEYLHQYDMRRMPECQFYSSQGNCHNPECMFLHIRPEDKLKECPWYARGFCKHGPKCRHKHIRRSLCGNYMAGFCPDGTECKFGHPKFEIPKEEDRTQIVNDTSTCHSCGQAGHTVATCPIVAQNVIKQGESVGRGRRPIETVTCHKCGELGHYANTCPARGMGGPYRGRGRGRGGPEGPYGGGGYGSPAGRGGF